MLINSTIKNIVVANNNYSVIFVLKIKNLIQNSKINIVLVLLLLITSFSSCTKQKLNADVRQIVVDADYRINDIYFVNQNLGFAVGGNRYEEGYILKTEDGGQNWERIPNSSIIPNEASGLQTLNSISFYNDLIGEAVGHGGKILRTENGGNSWEMIINGTYENFNAIEMLSANKTIISSSGAYADGSIFTSNNEWYNFDRQEFTYAFRGVDFINNDIGFLTGYGIVQKTIDGGNSWEIMDLKTDYFFDVDFVSIQTAYVCGWEGGIYKTNNQGETWKNIKPTNKVFANRQHYENIDFIDENTGVVCGYNGEVLYTKNGGDSWLKMETNTKEDFHSIYFYNANKIFVGGENGLFLELNIP